MGYNLQPEHNELTLCVHWNSIIFQAISARCSGPTLHWKFGPLNIRCNFNFYLGLKLLFLTYFLKYYTKKVLKTYKSIASKNFKPMPLFPITWRSFKVFAKLHESPRFTFSSSRKNGLIRKIRLISTFMTPQTG